MRCIFIVPFPQTRCQFRSICGVHPDNKENNGNKDKPELGNIKEHPMHKSEEEYINGIDNGIDKQEGQACQTLVLIPFH